MARIEPSKDISDLPLRIGRGVSPPRRLPPFPSGARDAPVDEEENAAPQGRLRLDEAIKTVSGVSAPLQTIEAEEVRRFEAALKSAPKRDGLRAELIDFIMPTLDSVGLLDPHLVRRELESVFTQVTASASNDAVSANGLDAIRQELSKLRTLWIARTKLQAE